VGKTASNPVMCAGEPLPEPHYDNAFKRWGSTTHNGPSRSTSLTSPREDGQAQEEGLKPLVSAQAFAFDQWVYRDPQVSLGRDD
jgi:hypothetical protein